MRLKQLLVVLLVSGLAVTAVAGAPQLTNLGVVGQGNTTTITLHVSGAFTHNEYRPSDGLLLVDLIGVSAGKLQDRVRALQVPGVTQYHVVGYAAAGGVQVARVELKIQPGAEAKVNEVREGLAIQVTASEAAPSAAPGTAEKPVVAAAEPPAEPSTATPAPSGPVQVQNVAVVHGSDGIEVEVSASAPLQPQTTTLTRPDRVVIDFPNSVPAGRPRAIKVNAGDVRSVRMGRFQSNPPVTRVVIDLDAPQEFDLVENGSKLLVRLHPARTGVQLKPAVATASTATLNPALAETSASTPTSAVDSAPVKAEASPAVDTSEPAPAVAEAKPVSASTPVNEVSTPAATPPVAGASVPAEPKIAEQPAKEFVMVQPPVQQRHDMEPQGETPRLVAANSGPASTPAMAAPMAAPQNAPVPAPAPAAPVQSPVNFAAEQRQQAGQPAPTRPRYTGEPISVNLKDADLKDFFRLIHEISGLNIVLDPTIRGTLTLVLDDVPWDQALDIVLKNNGLERQLDGNVLRIATVDNLRKEAEARRKQVEAQALAVDKVTATRFLSYAHAREVLPTLKKLLSARGDIVADERTNALIITDIPSVIGPLDNLIAQLDRKTMEVEIEARVVAATRTFARSIGMQLGFAVANAATNIGGAPFKGFNSPIGSPQPGTNAILPPSLVPPFLTTNGTDAIPLFSNLPANNPSSGAAFTNVGSNYRVDAILTMAESRGLLKVLSRPRVITQNNIQAVVKQGTRIPVVTQAQLGGPPTTQFVEAVLRLTVTPQITIENTIFLNVDIENTTPDFGNQILGVPTLLTQQATTQVLVTNGGTVVIGGVLQSQNSLNVGQVPLLGDIPILGNLFKNRSVDTRTQELIFFITPRIVET